MSAKLTPYKDTLHLTKDYKRIIVAQGQAPPLHVNKWTKGPASPAFDRVILSVDPGEHAGLVVLGLRTEDTLWPVELLCALQRNLRYAELKNLSLKLAIEYDVTDIVIENSSIGAPLYADLYTSFPVVQMHTATPSTSKYTRALRVSAFADANLCVTPKVEALSLQQFSLFPTGVADDAVDALTQGLELAAEVMSIELPEIVMSDAVFSVGSAGYVIKAARNVWWAADRAGAVLAKEQTRDAAVSVLLARCPQDFPSRLREARRKAGLTIRVVAEQAGINSYQTISFLENGAQCASLEQVVKLATVLKVNAGWLAFGEEAKEK